MTNTGTLVNPGFVIPAETTHITGIHQDDLRHAPLLKTALPKAVEFIGNAPVIAHNAAFDIGFMRRFNTLKQNLPLDTFELASILLPRTPRYSLSSLAERFDIQLENAHRALDDARATAILYWRLWQKPSTYPNIFCKRLCEQCNPSHGIQARFSVRHYKKKKRNHQIQNLKVSLMYLPLCKKRQRLYAQMIQLKHLI
ncbi:MAG: 3'-5' exonuclease [Anaerolineae bacterium]|nr:3'-5' exonuclease [Anaerolineae bacterium]